MRRDTLHHLLHAIELDRTFLAAHPDALFQCLWNRAWWSDAPAAGAHFSQRPAAGSEAPDTGRLLRLLRPRRDRPASEAARPDGAAPLSSLLEQWRAVHARRSPGRPWLRALRPPALGLERGATALFRAGSGERPALEMVFSPASDRLFTLEEKVSVWSARNGELLRTLPTCASCLAVSRDGRSVATGGIDHLVRLWDPETGEESSRLTGHAGPVGDLCFGPDGRVLVSCGSCSFNEWGSEVDVDPTVRIWNVDAGRETRCLRAHRRPIRAVRISEDGALIVSMCAESLRVWQWGAETPRFALVFREFEDDPVAVALAPDARRVAIACADATLRIHDAGSGAELARASEIGERVTALAFASDGTLLVSGHRDGQLRLWNPTNGRKLREFATGERPISALAVDAGAERIRAGATDGSVHTLKGSATAARRELRGPSQPIRVLAFSPDGEDLLTASQDEPLRLWDPISGLERRRIALDFHPDRALFSRDGSRIAASRGLRLVVVDREGRHATEVSRDSLPDLVACLAFSPDGEAVAVGTESVIALVATADGGGVRRLALTVDTMGVCTALAWGRHPRWLASGHGFRAGAWTPESLLAGSVLAEHVPDHAIRLWDLENGEVVRTLTGHEADVVALAFSLDDRRLASVDERFVTRVWDIETGECLERLDGLVDPAVLVAGSDRFAILALARRHDLEIRTATSRARLAGAPVSPTLFVTHPSGRLWAVSEGRHLQLFFLEDGAPQQ